MYKRQVICSADTVIRRLRNNKLGLRLQDFDLVIVDECHDCTATGYELLLQELKSKIIIGYTATPFRVGKVGHSFWHRCVAPVTADDLCAKGHLVPLRIMCPNVPDLKGVRTSKGDYAPSELMEKMSTSTLYGDIVNNYKQYCNNGAALLFAVTVKHAEDLAERFREEGYMAYSMTAATCQRDRDQLMQKFRERCRARSPFILCNVNVLSTGIDIPEVENIIMARPTKSLVLFLQQVGRVIRPAYGKDNALLLDHAGNTLRHGHPYDKRSPHLSDRVAKIKKESSPKATGRLCQSCSAWVKIVEKVCPVCHTNMGTPRKVTNDKGVELVQIKDRTIPVDELKHKIRAYYYVLSHQLRGSHQWINKKIIDAYGEYGRKFVEERDGGKPAYDTDSQYNEPHVLKVRQRTSTPFSQRKRPFTSGRSLYSRQLKRWRGH